MKKLLGAWLALGSLLIGAPGWSANADKPPIIVFAAASLTNILQEVGDGFTKQTSIPVKFSFAASSTLAHQIENGIPADVFFSADLQWMDYLQIRMLIQRESRHDVLGNRLALIVRSDSAIKLTIEPNFQLVAALGKGRLAMEDPDSGAAGRYAKEALTALGVWNTVSDRLTRTDTVRSAMASVDRGEAALGIVYETDALIDKRVRVVDVFPEGSHPPIVYPIALTMTAKADAAKFIAYVRSPAGALVFKTYGFAPLR